jgi:hypothetical protein
MNCYRVKFETEHESLCLWVEARNEHHAVMEATMLAMGGTGNNSAQTIEIWLLAGTITNVYSVIETN